MDKLVTAVEKGSLAEKYGICAGDSLTGINGEPVHDIFDYRYLMLDTVLDLDIKRQTGNHLRIKIHKAEHEDLGLCFDSGLMDDAKGCANKCIFCFIDQLPKNMRKSLYFKDDDSRLSFLHGNYVTLTNMSKLDLERITYYHLSPINVSVHSTDPALRVFMLKNPAAANIKEQLETLRQANISMNFQIVLCKNINDGAHLDKTISELGGFMPNAHSLSVVPAGLTDFRYGLHNIDSFTLDDSAGIVAQIEKWQQFFLREAGTRFVYAADEFYLNAKTDIPGSDYYEDFPQIENGVGMFRAFADEFTDALKNSKCVGKKQKRISIATGEAAHGLIRALAQNFMNKHKNIDINVVYVSNNYFGKKITVSGLMTGTDIISHIKKCVPGEKLLIPATALRADEPVFLDDLKLSDLERELGVPAVSVRNSGYDLVAELLRY